MSTHNPKVVGSNPASATTKNGLKPWFQAIQLFCNGLVLILLRSFLRSKKSILVFLKSAVGIFPAAFYVLRSNSAVVFFVPLALLVRTIMLFDTSFIKCAYGIHHFSFLLRQRVSIFVQCCTYIGMT